MGAACHVGQKSTQLREFGQACYLQGQSLQLWIDKHRCAIQTRWRISFPNKLLQLGKDIRCRPILLEDGEDSGRNIVESLVVGDSPDSFAVYKDLLPIFFGRRFDLRASSTAMPKVLGRTNQA
jgi:hypothetical protein